MAFALKSAEFITAASRKKHWPPAGPPEVAFAGRSNVGKSSLINSLVRRKKLVRVSKRPGRTQQINFFAINGDWLRLVDLPGYGFAKVPLKVKATWQGMIEEYITGRDTLRAVVVILDIRRQPSGEDLMLLDWLRAVGVPIVLAVTKADKLSRGKMLARLAQLGPALQRYDAAPIACSAPSGQGREELWQRLLALAQPADPPSPPPAADA